MQGMMFGVSFLVRNFCHSRFTFVGPEVSAQGLTSNQGPVKKGPRHNRELVSWQGLVSSLWSCWKDLRRRRGKESLQNRCQRAQDKKKKGKKNLNQECQELLWRTKLRYCSYICMSRARSLLCMVFLIRQQREWLDLINFLNHIELEVCYGCKSHPFHVLLSSQNNFQSVFVSAAQVADKTTGYHLLAFVQYCLLAFFLDACNFTKQRIFTSLYQ